MAGGSLTRVHRLAPRDRIERTHGHACSDRRRLPQRLSPARLRRPSAGERPTAGDAETPGEGRSTPRFCQNEAKLRAEPEA